MPIGGSATELNITGAKLKVSGGVQVSGSIAYTTDATGFGGVTAQIDGNNTLNVTSGKLTGVTKIERATAATINAITHTNVNNNTTIHIALKNTSTTRGVFITLETFASDDTVKVNYTDDYMIGPGETGMLTLRKVNNVLSLFAREMFSDKASTFTDDNTNGNRPFYIKDGVNYKYPLYKYTASGLTSIPINGVTYFKPTAGIRTKSRPPKGLPELIVTPSGNMAIGNSGDLATVNYNVWGVPSSFVFGSIYQGSTKKTSFILENGEASGSFTESGASSGDAYSLYVERTDTNSTDTVSVAVDNTSRKVVFHHGAFSASDYSSAYSTVEAAATAGHVYSDTSTTPTYTWGTLGTISSTSTNTTYTWTPSSSITANILMVAGGGGGGGHMGGGGGAGGLLHYTNQNISSGQKIIVVGNGGSGGVQYGIGTNGNDTSFTGLTTTDGGGRGGSYVGSSYLITDHSGADGGSGGGSGHNNISNVTIGQGKAGPPRQGNNGGQSGGGSDGGGGGGAGGTGDGGSSNNGGNGGIGLDKSSVFGTTYGESGWFASGGGGGSRNSTAGTASNGGGGGGCSGSSSSNDDAQKHTGGGGGGGGSSSGASGAGGSGIVIVQWSITQIGKKIPKVTGISFTSSNIVFTVQQDSSTSITHVKYTINGGSEVSTAVGTLSVAHSLSASAAISVVAWAVDTSGNQLSAKKTVTGTTPSQPTLVNTISLTGGDWSTQNPVGQYDYINTNTNSTYYEYELSIASGNSNYYIAYNWTTKKWFDTNTGTTDNTFGTSATDTGTTSRETSENPSVVYVFSSQLEAQFNNPYYQS